MSTLSMTGFGRASECRGDFRVEAEISTVNRKQFDCFPNLPNSLAPLEERCKALIHSAISRGRIQLTLRFASAAGAPLLSIDPEAVRTRVAELNELARISGLPNTTTALDLYRMPDLFGAGPTLDPEAVWPALEAALLAALSSLDAMRAREGAALRKDLEARLVAMRALRERIAEHAPSVPQAYRDALQARLAELGVNLPVDADALAREVALMADRCDIAEELTRLNTHFDHALALFDSAEPSGRKLDFLCQEMNREANTIGSKANDATITACVIDLKALIETFREQIQNLE